MITIEEFLKASRNFVEISKKLNDGWILFEDKQDLYKYYISKETFIDYSDGDVNSLVKAVYVIFYNISYGVPSFSFNIWNSSGVLLTLDEIRQLSLLSINEKDFYSVITQQEHPLFQRPYFIVHPCHTEELFTFLHHKTTNIIITFLGLITPLIQLKMPLEYGFGK